MGVVPLICVRCLMKVGWINLLGDSLNAGCYWMHGSLLLASCAKTTAAIHLKESSQGGQYASKTISVKL